MSLIFTILLFLIIFIIFTKIISNFLIHTFLKFSPWHTYVYPCFVFRKKPSNSTHPIKVGMIIDFTYIKAIYKAKSGWNRSFYLGLKKLFEELCKYKNQLFFVKTHTKILKKIKSMEKSGVIEIIDCIQVGKKWLWYTFKFPIEKVMFYEVTFKIKST